MKRFIRYYIVTIALFLLCCAAAVMFFYLMATYTALMIGGVFVIAVLVAIAGHTIEYIHKKQTDENNS